MSTVIREARVADAGPIAELVALLGHEVVTEAVEARLEMFGSSDCAQIVATDNGRIIGLCGLHIMHAIHRDYPVGRITILVVAPQQRGRGLGRLLVGAAEEHLRRAGCKLLEVTSNDLLTDAHQFYLHMGFEQTSKRFALQL